LCVKYFVKVALDALQNILICLKEYNSVIIMCTETLILRRAKSAVLCYSSLHRGRIPHFHSV